MSAFDLTLEVTTPIDAPIDVVWSLLGDLSSWSQWNPWVTRVQGAAAPRVGARVTLTVSWNGGAHQTARELITHVEQRDDYRRFDWQYISLPHRLGLLHALRRQELVALDPTRCEYRSSERFHGPATPLLPVGRMRDGFAVMGAALKLAAQQRASAALDGARTPN